MGVWIDGCQSDLRAQQHADNEWLMQLEEPAEIEGFSWHTSRAPSAHDPISFEILVSVDGADWKVAGASHRTIHFKGVRPPRQPTP